MTDNESRSPRRTRRAPLRNDFRSLIRSRPVQVVLLGCAVVQGVATATGTGPVAEDGKARRGMVQSAVRRGGRSEQGGERCRDARGVAGRARGASW